MSEMHNKHAKESLTNINSGQKPNITDDLEGERQRGGDEGGTGGRQGRGEESGKPSPRIVNHTSVGSPVSSWEEYQLRQPGNSFEDLDSWDDLKYSNTGYAIQALSNSKSLAPSEVSLPASVCRFVPPKLRSLTLNSYPTLRRHDGHRAFFLYLMTTTFRDDDTRRPVIPSKQIACCYGEYALEKANQGNLTTGVILRTFSRRVTNIEWSSPNRWLGKARTLQRIALDDSLRRAWEEALSSPLGENAVNFWSGEKRRHVPSQQQKCREALRERSRAQTAPCEDSQRWRDYLNRRDPELFESVLERLPEAYERVRRDSNFECEKQQEAKRHLRAIEEQPVPIYGFSGKTVRLTALNPSLQTIDGDLRHILTEEWIELDLSSAQLAIAGGDWGIPEVVEFLGDGTSIWKDLASFLDVPIDVKPALKKGLYAAVYGASVENIPGFILDKADYEGTQFPEEKAEQFKEHPLVRELLQAREVQLNQIKEQGGAENCYGQWIDYSGIDKKKPERSILAQLNQAREMWLLGPVLRRAENQDEGKQPWEVTLLQHDGFSVKVHDGQEEDVVQTLKNAVADLVEDHGYPTRLEVESTSQ